MKPGMLVRRVAQHLIEDELEATRMRLLHEPVEIGHRPHFGCDAAIIRHVIAKVPIGRRIDGREPDGVDAERGDVVELPLNALQIADAVAVGVEKAAWIYLVDHRALPPRSFSAFRTHDNASPHALCFMPLYPLPELSQSLEQER